MDRFTFIQWFYKYYQHLDDFDRGREINRIKLKFEIYIARMGEYSNKKWMITKEEARIIRAGDDKKWKKYLKNYVVDEKDAIS